MSVRNGLSLACCHTHQSNTCFHKQYFPHQQQHQTKNWKLNRLQAIVMRSSIFNCKLKCYPLSVENLFFYELKVVYVLVKGISLGDQKMECFSQKKHKHDCGLFSEKCYITYFHPKNGLNTDLSSNFFFRSLIYFFLILLFYINNSLIM